MIVLNEYSSLLKIISSSFPSFNSLFLFVRFKFASTLQAFFRVKGGEENSREAKNYRSAKEGYEMMIDKKCLSFNDAVQQTVLRIMNIKFYQQTGFPGLGKN